MKTYTIDDDIKLLEGYRTVVVPYLMQRLADLEEKNNSTIDFESDNKRLLELAYLGVVIHEVNEIVEQLDPESCIKTIKKLRKFYIEHHGCIGKTKDKDCYEMISLLQSLAEFEKRKGMTDDD